MNIQGFTDVKKDQIVRLINEWNISVLCLVETHNSNDITDFELAINNFTLFRCDTTNRRTGGVLIYVKKNIGATCVDNICYPEYYWLISIKVRIHNEEFLIAATYHAPEKKDNLFIDHINDFIEDHLDFSGNLLILGDFNFDLLKESFYGNAIQRVFFKHAMYQSINEPTRITATSRTLIDYCVSNNKGIKGKVRHTPKLSDHSMIIVELPKHNPHDDNELVCFSKRSYKNYTTEAFHAGLDQMVWETGSKEINDIADLFANNVSQAINQLCPMKEVTIKKKYVDNKWMTPRILEAMRVRDKAYVVATSTLVCNARCSDVDTRMLRDQNWILFKRERNYVTALIKKARDDFCKSTMARCGGNGRLLWKNIKIFLPGKKQGSVNDNIFLKGRESRGAVDNINFLNQFYVTSISDIVQSIPRQGDTRFILNRIRYYGDWQSFEKIHMGDLDDAIKNLNACGDVGDDGISTQFLVDALKHNKCKESILSVINESLEKGIFPENWKLSYISPTPKVPKPENCEDYRPINKVPIYEKLLETVVKNQLFQYCDKYNILSKNQSGFRPAHSCETSLVNIYDKWLREIDINNNYVLVVFLDFKRAFETVDRNLLISKMKKMGLGGRVIKWFLSYLTGRSQRIKLGRNFSDILAIAFGVPQGTILGPLLFILFVNDIEIDLDCFVNMLADDTAIYLVGPNLADLVVQMNLILKKLYRWICENSLALNIKKTKYMIIANRSNLNKVVESPIIRISQDSIDRVLSYKYLGVILDQMLNLKEHVSSVINKVAKKLYLLNRVGRYFPSKTRLLLYKSLVGPHIDYCSPLLLVMNQNEIAQLQKLQNRAMRYVTGFNRYTPIDTLFAETRLLSVKKRVLLRSLILCHKIKLGVVPPYLIERLDVASNVHNYNTRNNDDRFYVERTDKRLKKTIFGDGVIAYNRLPPEVKQLTIVNFKKSVLKFL